MGAPGAWRPTTVFDGVLRPVRGLPHPITSRGAFRVHAGAAETDARLRIFGRTRLEAGQEAFVRITTAHPLVLDVFDRFVLRESGRQETLGGGSVLDPAPPRRAGPSPQERLARRAAATREDLPAILADERGAVRASDALALTGSTAGVPQAGEWLLRDGLLESVGTALIAHVDAFHQAHPLEEGEPLASARRALAAALRPFTGPPEARLVEAVLDRLAADGRLDAHEHLGREPLTSTRRPGERPDRSSVWSRRSAPSPRSHRPSRSSCLRASVATRSTRPPGPASSCASPPISCSSLRSSSGPRPSSMQPAAPASR